MIRVTMTDAVRTQTPEVVAKLYDGKLRRERRNGAAVISARTFVRGKLVRRTNRTSIHAPDVSARNSTGSC